MWVSGSKAYVHVPKERRRKLYSLSTAGIFVGYEQDPKAYRVLMDSGKVEVFRDVIFVESRPATFDRCKCLTKDTGWTGCQHQIHLCWPKPLSTQRGSLTLQDLGTIGNELLTTVDTTGVGYFFSTITMSFDQAHFGSLLDQLLQTMNLLRCVTAAKDHKRIHYQIL